MKTALIVHPGAHWSVSDVYRGWVRGLTANGVAVQEFSLNNRLDFYSKAMLEDPEKPGLWHLQFDFENACRAVGQGLHAACYQLVPDYVIVICAAFLPSYVYDLIRARGTKVIIIHTESPYEDERQMVLGEHADLHIINDPTNIERWRLLGPTEYIPHAYDPAIHRPGPSRFDYDVSWIGTAGGTWPSRTAFMEAVDWTDLNVVLGGLWSGTDPDSPLIPLLGVGMEDCVDNEVTAEIMRGSKCTFNLYRSDMTDDSFEGAWAMGPREVEIPAIGCLMARHAPADHGGEAAEVLPMLPAFTDPGELTDIFRFYCSHEQERRDTCDRAMAAIADRTFENHAARLLRILDAQ